MMGKNEPNQEPPPLEEERERSASKGGSDTASYKVRFRQALGQLRKFNDSMPECESDSPCCTNPYAPLKTGTLLRRFGGGEQKTAYQWRRRIFTLRSAGLTMWASNGDLIRFPLNPTLEVKKHFSDPGTEKIENIGYCFSVKVDKSHWTLAAASQTERDAWCEAIIRSLSVALVTMDCSEYQINVKWTDSVREGKKRFEDITGVETQQQDWFCTSSQSALKDSTQIADIMKTADSRVIHVLISSEKSKASRKEDSIILEEAIDAVSSVLVAD
jgi:hypothetical protein